MDPANSVLNRLERKKTARFPFLSSENISAVRLRRELGTGAGEKKVGGAKSSVHPCRETRCLRRALCSAEGKKKKPRDSSPFSTSFASAPYKESQDSDWMELSPSPSARAAALSLSPPTPSYLHYYTYSILPQQRKRPSLFLVLFLSLHPQQPVWCVRFHSSLPPTSSIYPNTNSASHSWLSCRFFLHSVSSSSSEYVTCYNRKKKKTFPSVISANLRV